MATCNEADRLRSILEYRSDMDLIFEGGQSTPAHSLKLSIASSVLRDLLDDILDDQIESTKSSKRRRSDEASTSDGPQKPHVKVLVVHDWFNDDAQNLTEL